MQKSRTVTWKNLVYSDGTRQLRQAPSSNRTAHCSCCYSNPMEEQACLSASRKGYRGHMTCLFHKINDLSSNDFDHYIAKLLGNAVEQLTNKLEKIKTLDEQLFSTVVYVV